MPNGAAHIAVLALYTVLDFNHLHITIFLHTFVAHLHQESLKGSNVNAQSSGPVCCAHWGVARTHLMCKLVCRRHLPRSIFLPPQFLSGSHCTSTTRLVLHLVTPPGVLVDLALPVCEHHPSILVLNWELFSTRSTSWCSTWVHHCTNHQVQ